MKTERAQNRVLIAVWLQREGFSLADLVKACEFPRQMMQAIKSGRDVRLSTMVKLLRGARALARRKVEIEELFDFDSNDSEVEPSAFQQDTNSLR